MATRMSIFAKRSVLTPEDFRAHWRNVHAPIALRIPSLLRYEQNQVIERVFGFKPSILGPVDGVCKLWFESEASMQGVMSPQMVQALRDDEAQFIEGLKTFVIEPHVVLEPDAHLALKFVIVISRSAGLDEADFALAWRGEHAQRVRSIPGVRGYVQNFISARTAQRQPVSYEQLPVDCVDEIWLNPQEDERVLPLRISELLEGANRWARCLESFRVEAFSPAQACAS